MSGLYVLFGGIVLFGLAMVAWDEFAYRYNRRHRKN